ncbi:acyl-CoA desaturase, partial [Xanthomonas sp. Kuri4-1]
MSRVHNRTLSPVELQSFGDELDALRARVLATVGAGDARYIRRIVAAVRWSGFAGRALLFLGAFVHSVLIPAWIAGVALLA